MKQNNYEIAGCCFGVCGKELVAAVENLHGFHPFTTTRQETEFLFRYSDEEADIPETDRLLYAGETDGVSFRFYTRTTTNGHLLMMEHSDGDCLYAWSEPDARIIQLRGKLTAQMLRFALWMGYGIMTVDSGRIALHGSCIVKDGKAYLFLGESGTGKSTHTRLWREHIADARLLNDDSPVVRAAEGQVWIYGSPWSGKTPCYKQERYPLCGCVRLVQASSNEMVKLSKLKAYAALHPSCPPEFAYDNALYDPLSETIHRILLQVPFYLLKCLPDACAAQLSHQTLSADETV